MYASPETETAPFDRFDLEAYSDTNDRISGLLARCEAVRREIEGLRVEHARLLDAAAGIRHDYEADRQRRAQETQTTLRLMSALAMSAADLPHTSQPAPAVHRQERAA